jgi:hypothetical protein
MEQHTKNGLPWTGAMRFPDPVKKEYLENLLDLWKEQDWGEKYQNHRRPLNQLAIYPATRVVTYIPSVGGANKKFIDLSHAIADELQKFFPYKMTFWISEIVLLTPKGYIPWHVDFLEMCRRSTRVIIPLTPQDDIKYHFCSWSSNTPTNKNSFNALFFLNSDEYQVDMNLGNYYLFNHRIPHKTVSNSTLPRATFSIDMIQESEYNGFIPGTAPITEFEKKIILPPIL